MLQQSYTLTNGVIIGRRSDSYDPKTRTSTSSYLVDHTTFNFDPNIPSDRLISVVDFRAVQAPIGLYGRDSGSIHFKSHAIDPRNPNGTVMLSVKVDVAKFRGTTYQSKTGAPVLDALTMIDELFINSEIRAALLTTGIV